MSTELPYTLGCPVWACEHWKGNLYTASAPRRDWLRQYSSVFNTVEVNSTFYGLPNEDTFRRWGESTEDGFEFCLKMPQAITHDARLRNCDYALTDFLNRMEILAEADRLGPSFIQLPPTFSAREWPALEAFLSALPCHFRFAVEVRHADYFDDGPVEQRLDALLSELGMDRCLFDSRALYSAPPSDEAEVVSQSRKPRSPYRTTVTSQRPMVRIVGRNDVDATQPWIDEWADVVTDWIADGLRPIVFTHSPDDTFAPAFGREFHKAMMERQGSLEKLNPWPGESEADARQMTLF